MRRDCEGICEGICEGFDLRCEGIEGNFTSFRAYENTQPPCIAYGPRGPADPFDPFEGLLKAFADPFADPFAIPSQPLMPPRKRPPAWVADRIVSDKARLTICRRCGAPVIRAWVGSFAAHLAHADPVPLDLAAELNARLAGRSTYCLAIRPYLPARLLHRDRWHIAAGTCTHHVVAAHNCPRGHRS